MKIAIEIIFLLIGFAFLVKGADIFVEGSSATARKLKIPSVVVGLTIVAIGTSLPELAVSTLAAARGANGMSLGNVIGSNIFNGLMVLGVSSLFINTNVKESLIKREFPFLGITTVVTLLLGGDLILFGGIIGKFNIFQFKNKDEIVGTLERTDGLFFLVLFIIFIVWTVSYALRERRKADDEDLTGVLSTKKCVLFIILGALAILAGGEIVVRCAKDIALSMGMGETLVGLTIVALGTSLPELVTSAVAAKKGEADLAVGNVVGSNIANILLVLGLSASIMPIGVTASVFIDIFLSLIFTGIIFLVAFSKKVIKKGEGIFLILIYVAYLAYIICRQYM